MKFWERTEPDLNTGCLLWWGAANGGYGVVRRNKRMLKAHRVAYCESVGTTLADIEPWVIRHKCDTPLCVNPRHLEIGTNADNVRDKVLRGRSMAGSLAPRSKLTEDIVREIKRRYKPRDPKDGQAAMAREFGVTSASVCLIVSGKNWKYFKE